jgi:thiamine-phosphate pyrophosphorylase
MKTKLKDHNLYLVITEEYGSGLSSVEIAERAIKGGVDVIQMREKNKRAEELIAPGRALAGICKDSGVTFIVNDDPLLARDLDADGVHLGQEDLKLFPAEKVRNIMGRERIIGVSTHSLSQFEDANEKDFDYIAYGPIFETKTKDYFLGTGDIGYVLKIAKRPVFFIGGINLSNIEEVLGRGARNIALIRGITEAEDIAARTKEFKSKLRAKKGR